MAFGSIVSESGGLAVKSMDDSRVMLVLRMHFTTRLNAGGISDATVSIEHRDASASPSRHTRKHPSALALATSISSGVQVCGYKHISDHTQSKTLTEHSPGMARLEKCLRTTYSDRSGYDFTMPDSQAAVHQPEVNPLAFLSAPAV